MPVCECVVQLAIATDQFNQGGLEVLPLQPEPESLGFFRGLAIAVPISLALWGAILWALWAVIQ